MDSLPISGGGYGGGNSYTNDNPQTPLPPQAQPPMPQPPAGGGGANFTNPGPPPYDNSGPRGSTGSYVDQWGQTRWLMPGMAGRHGQFGSGHTFGGYDSSGRLIPFMDQQSQSGAPGQSYGGPPTDPAALAACNRVQGLRVVSSGRFQGNGAPNGGAPNPGGWQPPPPGAGPNIPNQGPQPPALPSSAPGRQGTRTVNRRGGR